MELGLKIQVFKQLNVYFVRTMHKVDQINHEWVEVNSLSKQCFRIPVGRAIDGFAMDIWRGTLKCTTLKSLSTQTQCSKHSWRSSHVKSQSQETLAVCTSASNKTLKDIFMEAIPCPLQVLICTYSSVLNQAIEKKGKKHFNFCGEGWRGWQRDYEKNRLNLLLN